MLVRWRSTGFAIALAVVAAAPALGIGIDPYYAANYIYSDLGSIPGVPPLYGGLNFKWDDPTTLIIGGNANEETGALYSIGVFRDAQGHIVAFDGTATFFAEGAWNDGGVTYGPGNVLFMARWPVNELGQTKPGSSITDKVIDLTPFGVESSHSANAFVPTGFPGEGRFKMVSWPDGEWNDVELAPDGAGTYDVVSATEVAASRLPGGPEGFIYVPLGSPLFDVPSILVSEFTAGRVASYEIDANGDPIVATRRDFVVDLEGAEGAVIDPWTGDFIFSTFGGGDRIIVVQGFVPEPSTIALLALAGLMVRRRG